MPSTYQSIVIDAPIEQVWDRVRDFHDLSWAPKTVESVENVGHNPGTEVGAVRKLNGVFEETLIEHNPNQHFMRYSIDEGPSPVSKDEVQNYVGTVNLRPVTHSDRTFVEWYSSWQASNLDAVDFCQNIYASMLEEMKATVESR